VVAGGGFIGHRQTRYRLTRTTLSPQRGCEAPGVPIITAAKLRVLHLRRWESCLKATRHMDQSYQLVANMGRSGSIEANKAAIVYDNTLIETRMLEIAVPEATRLQ
jgi:GDP-D-mannose 3', 5'-epimerase